MRILLGHRPDGYLDFDNEKYEVRYAPFGPDGVNAPRSIAEMLRTCPEGWIPDVYYHPSIGHVPLPLDIESFPGLAATDVEDSDRMGVAVWAGVGFFDLAISDRNTVESLKASRFEHAYRGRQYHFSHEFDRILPGIERDIDVLFIGMLNSDVWDERNRWLYRLAKLPYSIAITNGHFGEAYTQLMNRAKIVFNFGVRGESNGRTYQAPMCGAMLMMESTNAETRVIFTDRVHCVYYDNSNFEAVIEYYLNHETERSQIVKTASELISSSHSCRRHTNQIFEIFRQNLNIRYRPFQTLSEAERRRRSALQMYYTGNQAPAFIIEELAASEKAGGDRPGLLMGSAAVHAHAAASQNGDDKLQLLNYAAVVAAEVLESAQNKELPAAALGFINRELADANYISSASAESFLELAVGLLESNLKSHNLSVEDIDGFIYPHKFDRFDVLISRATLLRDIDQQLWAEKLRRILIWRCCLEISKISEEIGDLARAMSFAVKAAEIQPEEGKPYLVLGRLSTLQGNFAQAIDYYKAGLKILPLATETWPEYAATLALAGKWEEADKFVEEHLHIIDAIPPIQDIKQPLLASVGRG